MSHNIASVSQAAFLPQQTGPGISAVQSQPSFGFEENDASSARSPLSRAQESDTFSPIDKRRQILYQLVMIIRRILRAIWSPIAKALLS